jgi:2-dehydro-3-deoxyphosphogluconate aldolase/(4S)-4-hydroxy-2-oxoglutarate aldolase
MAGVRSRAVRGGSWVVPKGAPDEAEIERLAREASALAKG